MENCNEQAKSQMEIKKELWDLLFTNPGKLRKFFMDTPYLMIDHDSIYQALKMIERKNFMPEELEKNEKEIKGRTIWEEGMKKMIEEKLANENKKEVPAK